MQRPQTFLADQKDAGGGGALEYMYRELGAYLETGGLFPAILPQYFVRFAS